MIRLALSEANKLELERNIKRTKETTSRLYVLLWAVLSHVVPGHKSKGTMRMSMSLLGNSEPYGKSFSCNSARMESRNVMKHKTRDCIMTY